MSKLTILNPTTGEKIGEVPVMNEAEVKMAVNRARAAQVSWGVLSFKKRADFILKAREVLLCRMEEVASVVTQENGKPLIEAVAQDVMILMEIMTYYAKNTEKLLKKQKIKLGKWAFYGHKSYLEFEPHGVVGVIGPWNYPVSNPFGPAIMALMAGNAAIVKPSEFTPLSGLKIVEIFKEAGFPKDVFQVVTGDGLTGAALINAGIDHITFIGSVATGKKIMAAASKNLTPITLELGGKDPFVVLSDADLDLASSAAVWGAFSNCGQVCASVERVYVHESVAEPFTKMVLEKTKKLRQGSGLDPHVDIGSMTAAMQIDKVESHVEEAKKKGAHILWGGERNRELGDKFYKPTILTAVDRDFAVVRDETFGPVLPIMTFKSENEAIRMANDSPYGLNAYLWTGDVEKGKKLASQIMAGTVNVNETLFSFSVPQTPWGGMKESGIGRTHAALGLLDMVKIRHVYVNTKPSKKNSFWWFSYSPEKLEMVKALCFVLYGRGLKKIKGILTYLKLMSRIKTL